MVDAIQKQNNFFDTEDKNVLDILGNSGPP